MNAETLFSIIERILMLPLLIFIFASFRLSDILQINVIISTRTWIFLEIVCLILLLIAIIINDLIFYATGLGLFVIVSNYVNINSSFIILLIGTFIVMLILNTIKTGWRTKQPHNLGVINANNFSLIVLILVFIILFILIPILNLSLSSMVINLFLSIPSPEDPALVPLWNFLTGNIIGKTVIIIIAIAITYKMLQEIGSIISMYIVPSKSAVLEDAREWLIKETWLEPAFKYIGSFAESVIIAPLIYVIIMTLIGIISTKLSSITIINPFILSIVNFIIAMIVFFVVWYFISKLMSFEPINPTLKPILITGITVILIYLVIFIKYSILVNPFNPTPVPLDSYIMNTYISFYTTLFIMIQWILILMGVAP
jgi:hypothetical protein